MRSSGGFFDPNGDFNLIITVVVFVWASWQVWRGALLGSPSHAKPRLFVAVALTAGVIVNAAALLGWLDPEARGSIARAVTWVLAISLGFTAMTGVRYGKRVQAVASELDERLTALEEDQDG